MKHFYFTYFLVLSLVIAACSTGEDNNNEAATSPDTYPNEHLLLSAEELSGQLMDDNLLLIDARDEIEEEVIPGAVHFPAISSLVDPDHPIDFFLVGPDRFEQLMREIGLNNDSRVVIYDEGNNLSAARLFYALDYYGFSNAALLNGGIEGWKENEFEMEVNPATVDIGDFEVNLQENLSCDFEYIMAASEDDNKIIFDARSAAEYSGEDERAEKSGHIPNAVHVEWNTVLEQEGIPYFLPADDIRNLFESKGITPDKEVIPHCHTNVRGSHAYFTLRLMGYDSVRPYEGSWAEYGNRSEAAVQ